MLLLNEKDIKSVVTMKEVIEADKKAFQMIASGDVDVPLRLGIKAPKHDAEFLFMPSYAAGEEVAAVKVINIFPHNPEQGLNASPAQVLLIDGTTGVIVSLLDGAMVTKMRTGASSGAAFDVLGKKDCRIGGMIGTGGQAATQLEAMCAARDLEEVRIFDLKHEHCVEFCAKMQKQLAQYNTKFTPVNSADEACEEADLFITMTPSATPVFDGTKIKAGCTVSCVGTYELNKHEMDPAVLPRASKIICDHKETALSETGDLLIPIADGIITKDDVLGSLGDVIDGRIPGRESDDEIIVYETVGVASQDLMAAKLIYEKAKAAGIGTEWN